MAKKYIIELEDKVSENAKGDKLYFVKGFNNLSLDETALKKLTPYEEKEVKPEHEFIAGDIVDFVNGSGRIHRGIITKTTSDNFSLLLSNGEVRTPAWLFKDDTYTIKFVGRPPKPLETLLCLMYSIKSVPEDLNE